MALWHGFLPVFQVFVVSIVPPLPHSYSCTHSLSVINILTLSANTRLHCSRQYSSLGLIFVNQRGRMIHARPFSGAAHRGICINHSLGITMWIISLGTAVWDMWRHPQLLLVLTQADTSMNSGGKTCQLTVSVCVCWVLPALLRPV